MKMQNKQSTISKSILIKNLYICSEKEKGTKNNGI